jgi:hypothetical protein
MCLYTKLILGMKNKCNTNTNHILCLCRTNTKLILGTLQYLYLGLSDVLTKHLCAGTSIASGRVCRGDNLDDGLLMPKLS